MIKVTKVLLVLLNLIVYAVGMLNGIVLYRVINSGEIVASISNNELIVIIISSIMSIALVILLIYVINRLKKI